MDATSSTLKTNASVPCPLCTERRTVLFHTDRYRPYHHCPVCDLVFVPRTHHLDPDAERSRYDTHNNSPDDAGYRTFLSQLASPLLERLGDGSRGLDFGCGPGPTLSVMLEEAGHRIALYDPFYAPDRHVLEATYDVVTATEVVEHLRSPRDTLGQMWALVRPGGLMGLMTRMRPEPLAQFAGWYYANDETHIAFYARDTIRWLAQWLGASLHVLTEQVVILSKPS